MKLTGVSSTPVVGNDFGTMSVLPDEILLKIISADTLDLRSLSSLRLVCHKAEAWVDISVPEFRWILSLPPQTLRTVLSMPSAKYTCRFAYDLLHGIFLCAKCGATIPDPILSIVTMILGVPRIGIFNPSTGESMCFTCFQVNRVGHFKLRCKTGRHYLERGFGVLARDVLHIKKWKLAQKLAQSYNHMFVIMTFNTNPQPNNAADSDSNSVHESPELSHLVPQDENDCPVGLIPLYWTLRGLGFRPLKSL
ncbi:hypothetical protein B0T24DRAFT_598418 [Lasiosphaeria ovina]|uniref:F-box domain-containing protein n=1 Tax=Lasiosphaeria ovina TaxID=92902 RepID=A0AAE0JWQ3_9PEZI|nr:hypothetical protein B0T24DRAFT_598418 [Lasiosphaeria ovina]